MIQETKVENIGEYGKIIYRSDKEEFKHLFKKTDSKPKGIIVND